MTDTSLTSPNLPQLARSLSHAGFSAEKIRNRHQFLDNHEDSHIPVETIRGWLTEAEGYQAIEQLLTNRDEEAHQLRTRVAQLEAQLLGRDRLQTPLELAPDAFLAAELQRSPSRSPSPPSGSPTPTPSARRTPRRQRRSRSASPAVAKLLATVDHLTQQLAAAQQAAAQQTTANGPEALAAMLAAILPSVMEAVERRGSTAAPVPTPVAKPFKDYLPQLPVYTGDASGLPEAFLAAFRLFARQAGVPPDERTRQLSAKLAGNAHDWFTTEFAHQQEAVTEAQIACGLRKAFGREYEGVRAHRAMYQASANPDLGGAQRLRELTQREERARQHRVPYHVGPHEARFSRVLALFTDTEVNGFFNELSANARCSETALRHLEETMEASDDFGLARDSSLCPTSPEREALFALRVELAEAALRRIQPRPPPGGHPRAARVLLSDGSSGSPTLPTPAPVGPLPPPPIPPHPTASLPDHTAQCLQLTTERLTAMQGRGFKGPPHYFGDNEDKKRKDQNRAEFDRRKQFGLCFECMTRDLQQVPFLDCPLHGARAVPTQPPAASVPRTRA